MSFECNHCGEELDGNTPLKSPEGHDVCESCYDQRDYAEPETESEYEIPSLDDVDLEELEEPEETK